ncbi:hypothetical protein KIN20_007358 [Parelaphostrongylus tenuis]|uniref:Uncharacterized protein n=1 Tax=Parelaphostrongylus tenuis TaxID=148309 RepID=A0AAD5MM39_PARTN|nr:hypothetical protein KIN20_007358 [Parelaphostrongylus tenuis]
MEVSMKVRKQSEEKDKISDGSVRARKEKEEKPSGNERSIRSRKKKERKLAGLEFSTRARKKKEGKGSGVDCSERRRKPSTNCDISKKEKKKRKDDKDTDEGEKAKERKCRQQAVDVGISMRSQKKSANLLKRRAMKLAANANKIKGKRNNDGSEVNESKEKVNNTATDAQKAVFKTFVKEVVEMGVDGLLKEYAVFKPYLADNYARDVFDQNLAKNRYKGMYTLLTSNLIGAVSCIKDTDRRQAPLPVCIGGAVIQIWNSFDKLGSEKTFL